MDYQQQILLKILTGVGAFLTIMAVIGATIDILIIEKNKKLNGKNKQFSS